MQSGKNFKLGRFFKTFAIAGVLTLASYTGAYASGGHGAHWGYEGHSGPEHWGELSEDYKACSDGKSQSPIDITGAAKKDIPDIVFHYEGSKINILNNGHTVQVDYDKGSYIEVDGEKYKLLQFHFHTPSENTVDGEHYDAEMHLVHKSNTGALAVVAVLVDEGNENPAFETMWKHLPDRPNMKRALEATVNAANLLPKDKRYYRFTGSLTTPPCSEGVKWHVLATPIEMSSDQIEALEEIMGENNRPTQPLNDRSLELDTRSH